MTWLARDSIPYVDRRSGSEADCPSDISSGGPGMPWNAGSDPFDVEAVADPRTIAGEWRALEATGITTVFQRYDWIDAYVRHVLPHENARPVILVGRREGRPAFILPLAVFSMGPVRIARWIGGKHSSYNFGLWSPEGAAIAAQLVRHQFEDMLLRSLDGVDCLVLERTLVSHDGTRQPMSVLLDEVPTAEGYSFELPDTASVLLKKYPGGSKRLKKIRTKERRMTEAGPLKYNRILNEADAVKALDFFFEQKAVRLAEQGEPNSFADRGIREFYRDLVCRSQGAAEPILEMTEMTVAGKRHAVTGSGLHHGRMNVYFTAFVLDDLAVNSPGQLLSFRHIEDSCARKLDAYDLGIGYEHYKTLWCDVIHELSNGYAAFTPIGTVAVAAIRLREAIKARMRRNTFLWRCLKSVRSRLYHMSSR